jgi:hypothetical protein
VRLIRRLLNPVTRVAIITWGWNHRHEIRRWGRSLWAEVTGSTPTSPKRLMTIGKVLWAVATDPQLSNARQLRSIRLVGDIVELDVDPRWKRTGRLVTRLEAVDGVREVHVRGVGPVQPAIPGTAA